MTKILVFAYSAVGHACLDYLIQQKETIVSVVTHKDNPQETLWFPSVAKLAEAHAIPILTPENPNDPLFINHIKDLRPDLIFSFYYRHILAEEILNIPARGALNIHGSLLPKYRGRAPVNWAIIHGETQTGATLHHMVKKLDAGDIVDQIAFPIGKSDTAGKVMEMMIQASVQLLIRQLDALKAGTAPRTPLDLSKGTYFGGRSAKDGIINWQQTPQEIHNLIRSQLPYSQYPGATTTYKGKALRILGSRVIAGTYQAVPGQIVSLDPLQITGNDATTVLEITDYQWIEGKEKLELKGILGT